MPDLYNFGSYKVYFWINEGEPLEPVHFHISNNYSKDADKFWITDKGIIIPDKSNSKVPTRESNKILDILSSIDAAEKIVNRWIKFFGEICYVGS